MTRPRVVSLCTGVGGLDLALDPDRVDLVALAETDPRPASVLAARFPDIPNVGDWTDEATWDAFADADMIIGGLPCQPVSLAGQRRGTRDERWLFDDLIRLVRRLDAAGTRPVVFLESVPGMLTADNGHAMARICGGLAALGWVGEWTVLPASAVGAPHRRRRWWLLAAHPDGPRPEGQWWRPPRASKAPTHSHAARYGDVADAVERWERITGRAAPADILAGQRVNPRVAEWMMGFPDGWVTGIDDLSFAAQLRALGNAVVPHQAAAAAQILAARLENREPPPLPTPPTGPLIPTPVATDAAGTRNLTARRRPGSTGRPGRTLTDWAWITTGLADTHPASNRTPTPTSP